MIFSNEVTMMKHQAVVVVNKSMWNVMGCDLLLEELDDSLRL